jgi:AcrR family transcriptional regulator
VEHPSSHNGILLSIGETGPKRAYDATRRRERAEEERRATRRRVVEAATRAFVAKGYTATTMAEIAREAGVALQSVYTAASSKAELLHLVVDRAVAGDDEEVLVHNRQVYAEIAAEPSAEEQVRMIAGLIATIQERSAPVQAAYREAAAVDPKVAASVEAAHRRRHESFTAIIRMLPAHRLRRSAEESTDTMWAIGSSEVFLLLRNVRGWDAGRYRDWLSRTLVDQLLLPEN